MKRKKLITSLILCFTLVASILPSTVNAATDVNNATVSLLSTNAYNFSWGVDTEGKVMISSTTDPDYYSVSVAQVSPYVNLTGRVSAPNQEFPYFEFNINSLLEQQNKGPLVPGARYRVWVASVVNNQIQNQSSQYFTYQP